MRGLGWRAVDLGRRGRQAAEARPGARRRGLALVAHRALPEDFGLSLFD
jgi:hypothetical protein